MRLAFAIAACAATLSSAPAFAANRAFPVTGFEKLSVEGPYTVHVRTGLRTSVYAHGPQSRLDRLLIEMHGDTLSISTLKSAWNWGWSMGDHDNVVIDVTVPMLNAAKLTGSGDVNIDAIRTPAFETALTGSGDLAVAHLETGRLTATLTGSGDLTLNGRAGRADTAVRGSGDLKAAGLAVETLAGSVTGSGDLTVGPARQANLTVTGSGDIAVAGHPACTTSKHGSGDIRCGG
jgi:hypothetical protein